MGCFIAPHRCPHCEEIPADIFPLPPYSVTDPDPLPHYYDLFPPGYTLFPNPNTHLHPSFTTLPTPSIPLDPPPSYDSLFTTAAPPDSAVAPQVPLITGTTPIYGILMLSQTGTCSSSPPPYFNFYLTFFNPLLKLPLQNEDVQWNYEEEALPPKWSKYIQTCEYMFHFFFDFW